MILQHFQTGPLSTEVLNFAQEISDSQNITIYVFWDAIGRKYSISDSKTIFAPIIAGGYTPEIDAVFYNGHRLQEPNIKIGQRDLETIAFLKYVRLSHRGLTIGNITYAFNDWWKLLTTEQQKEYAELP